MKSLLTILGFLCLASNSVVAQGPPNDPPRLDDHFWRRRVVLRLDLEEKINKPIVYTETNIYNPAEPNNEYGNSKGLVRALISGLRDLKYPAFNPDTLNAPMTYDQLVAELAAIEGQVSQPELPQNTETESDGGFDDFGGDFGDDFGDFGGDFGDFGDDFGGDFGGEDALSEADLAGGGSEEISQSNFTSMQSILEIIEDRVFDKNKSSMYYDVQYIRLVWKDPIGQLPDENMIAFRYEDVQGVLNNTMYKNFWNDADNRTLKEVFELRLFNSFVINVSGREPISLEEAELRRQQMVEFEHNLWEF